MVHVDPHLTSSPVPRRRRLWRRALVLALARDRPRPGVELRASLAVGERRQCRS